MKAEIRPAADGRAFGDPIIPFVDEARRYCELIEMHERIDTATLLRAANSSMAALYLGALALPPLTAEECGMPPIDTDRWQQIFRAFNSKLGAFNEYRMVFDPVDDAESESLVNVLAADLAGVYTDIKTGLLRWDAGSGEGREEAIRHWRCSFATHWGRHATNALRPLYSWLYLHAHDAPPS